MTHTLPRQIHIISAVDGMLPFTLDDASRTRAELQDSEKQYSTVSDTTRLDNRIVDLRTPTNQAIFRIQSAVCQIFRDTLNGLDFIEIHSPKLQGAATESGASVFKVEYFKTHAYLAQSPQLAKQMCIAADFERVYEIAPVFRAENSNTPRHLTEFVGLDLEMALDEHYHEALDLIENLLLTMFRRLKAEYATEIALLQNHFPSEADAVDFLIPDKPVRLHFSEGIALLREAGIDAPELEDLSTEHERKLGALVREKYQTDFYTLDQFPTGARPFYTMPNADQPQYSNSYDCFMRGQEILSGAQRIHDPAFLVKRMKECGVAPESMQAYLDAFKLAAPPHAGGGIGLGMQYHLSYSRFGSDLT